MTPDRPRLTRDAVLRAAQSIIDERGLEACTMRAVAAELGVEAMSLYWHVPGKDALLDGVVALMLDEMDDVFARDGDWALALGDFARTYRDVVRRHRNVIPLLIARPLPAYRAAGRMLEQGIDILEAAGFDRRTAARATRALARYVLGFTLVEPEWPPAPDEAPDSPAVDELLQSLTTDDPDDLFEFGLETLLRGLTTWRGSS